MVDLTLVGINLGEEFDFGVVCQVLGCRLSCENKLGGLQVKLQVGFVNIGSHDGQVDHISGGIAGGRALRPEDCERVLV